MRPGELFDLLREVALDTSEEAPGRTEDPDVIIAEIAAGIPPNTAVAVEPDRRVAIVAAIERARPGDTVLIAGKGHENYQILGTGRVAFDDRIVVREALENPEPGKRKRVAVSA